MTTLHELCASGFYKEIGRKIARKRRDEVKKRIFEAS
jgi:hypothetical protein